MSLQRLEGFGLDTGAINMTRQRLYLAVPGKSDTSDQSPYLTFRGMMWNATKQSLVAKAAAAFTRWSSTHVAVKRR